MVSFWLTGSIATCGSGEQSLALSSYVTRWQRGQALRAATVSTSPCAWAFARRPSHRGRREYGRWLWTNMVRLYGKRTIGGFHRWETRHMTLRAFGGPTCTRPVQGLHEHVTRAHLWPMRSLRPVVASGRGATWSSPGFGLRTFPGTPPDESSGAPSRCAALSLGV